MKFLLNSIGTRGDVEPFITFAVFLKEQGHEVKCVFPEQFRLLSEDAGIPFASLGPEFIQLVEGDDGKLVMGGKGSMFKKLKAYIRLYKAGVKINRKLVAIQHDLIESEKPDRIIYNGKSSYPILWEINNPRKTILVSPIPCLIHPVWDHPHVGFKGDYGKFLNKLTYKLATYGLIQNVKSTTKSYRANRNISGRDLKNSILNQKLVYAISPSIFPKPDYWPKNVQVLGYHERNKTNHWVPTDSLESFLAENPKCLFVTFGSMLNDEPEVKTAIIMTAAEKLGIPLLINTAAGGLIEPDTYDKSKFHFVSNIPYDWVFPKVYGVIHHGGSGTTHLTMKYGCASMIIPHIIDQFLWNDILSEAGVGPKGMQVTKLAQTNLEISMRDLFQNEAYKISAKKMSDSMLGEGDMKQKLIDYFCD